MLHCLVQRACGDDTAIDDLLAARTEDLRGRPVLAAQRAVEDGEFQRRPAGVVRQDARDLLLRDERIERSEIGFVLQDWQLPISDRRPEIVCQVLDHEIGGLAGYVGSRPPFSKTLSPCLILYSDDHRVTKCPLFGAVLESFSKGNMEGINGG